MLKRPLKWLREQGTATVAGSAILIVLGFFLYIWRLGSLVPGFSANEAAAKSAASSFHKILDNPLFAPHKILQAILQHLGFHGPTSMRLVSVLFGVVFIGCFYRVANSWYGKQASFFSTLIFVATPLALICARNATPDILFLWPVAIAAAYGWLMHTKTKGALAWLAFCVITAISFYIPGLLWFVIFGVIFVRDKLLLIIKSLPRTYTIGGLVLAALIISGAVWGGASHHQIAKQMLGLPTAPMHLKDTAKSVAWAASSLVWRTEAHNPLVLGRLGLLNILQIVLAVVGGWALWTRSVRRVVSVLGAVVLTILLAGISFTPSLMLAALPAVSLLVGVAFRYLFVEWKERFPRNPLPHYFALIVISAVIAIDLGYALRYVLIAWPHAVATSSLYVLK